MGDVVWPEAAPLGTLFCPLQHTGCFNGPGSTLLAGAAAVTALLSACLHWRGAGVCPTLHISHKEIQKRVLRSPSLQTRFPVCSEPAVPRTPGPTHPTRPGQEGLGTAPGLPQASGAGQGGPGRGHREAQSCRKRESAGRAALPLGARGAGRGSGLLTGKAEPGQQD